MSEQIFCRFNRNSNWWETDQLVTKRGGVKSGTTELKSILWQRGGFEVGSYRQQIQRPNRYAASTQLGRQASDVNLQTKLAILCFTGG